MQKEISVKQLRQGMYLSKLCGSWLKHPFWRSAFLLEKKEDIDAIVKSGIERVIIDISKGLDVTDAAPKKKDDNAQSTETSSAGEADVTEQTKSKTKKPQKKSSMQAEWNNAKQICDEAKGVVANMFQEIRMGNAINIDEVKPIVDDISNSVIRNPSALINVARLKTLDEYTYLHSVAVCALMAALAKELDMDDEQVTAAAQGGLLHDLGKSAIPNDVLNKPGKLTNEEFKLVKEHPQKGYDLLVGNQNIASQALDIALHHHEKFDGTGYPDGLKGEEITLFARMGAVCDVYDAVTSNRSYKKAWSPAVAIKRMASWEGHFDPVVLQAFIKTLGIYPVGSLVKLKSNKLAVVIDQSESSLLTPKIKVFFSAKTKSPIEITELDLSSKKCNESIAGIEDPDNWRFKNLDDFWTPS